MRSSGGPTISAKVIVPLVMDLVRPASVVDVGCGTGVWLAQFVEAGVSTWLGLDGDYVNRADLRIDPQTFQAADLAEPQRLDQRFDLAVSLEVGEHLPEEAAAILVGSLVAAAPVVLFSSAIPGQGGNHHINEQWPEYWAELFEQQNYVTADVIRPKVWDNESVAPFLCTERVAVRAAGSA